MGYTHYYYRKPELDAEKYAAAMADCKKVCDASGVALAGWDETGEPVFTADEIAFNGVEPDGCETFRLDRVFKGRFRDPDGDGLLFSFTKTRQRPYDLPVMCCLIVFKHHFGQDVRIESDGDSEDWQPARDLCQETLGYGAEFSLGREEEEAETE